MDHSELFNLLKDTFGAEAALELVVTGDEKKGLRDPFILVATDKLVEICRFLRDDERTQFAMLHCISGVEQADCFESVYHLFSFHLKTIATLKARAPKDDPRVPSVASVWPAANWHERESYDMLGIVYEGHPDLARILLPDEWEGHPLRKDYEMPTHDRLREIGL